MLFDDALPILLLCRGYAGRLRLLRRRLLGACTAPIISWMFAHLLLLVQVLALLPLLLLLAGMLSQLLLFDDTLPIFFWCRRGSAGRLRLLVLQLPSACTALIISWMLVTTKLLLLVQVLALLLLTRILFQVMLEDTVPIFS